MEQEAMTTIWILITITSSLISGIVGVIISIIYYRKNEKRRAKIETLKNFVGYRYHLKGDNFTKTLNEIFIVFQDSKDVLEKLNQFHEVIVSRQTDLANDKLISLFKAMCRDLKINPNKYSESFFIKAFNVKE
jgi:NADH:ubiquinone oxidoreductase subunit 5 (subunit L)/multisubunit Na+/H+ antiporter MnhA subunit